MTRHVWLCFVLFYGCASAPVSPPAPVPPPAEDAATPAPGPTVEPLEGTDFAPVAAEIAPMQIVLTELAQGGWTCVPRSADTLDCPANASHKTPVRITYSSADSGCTTDDPCFLRLASYDAPRAFGTPCEKFEDAMNDLMIAAHHFSVTCSDTTTDPMTSQQFGFTTSITVTDPTHPGVVAALSVHAADREAAIRKLVSIKAVQRPKAAAPREKHDVVR